MIIIFKLKELPLFLARLWCLQTDNLIRGISVPFTKLNWKLTDFSQASICIADHEKEITDKINCLQNETNILATSCFQTDIKDNETRTLPSLQLSFKRPWWFYHRKFLHVINFILLLEILTATLRTVSALKFDARFHMYRL